MGEGQETAAPLRMSSGEIAGLTYDFSQLDQEARKRIVRATDRGEALPDTQEQRFQVALLAQHRWAIRWLPWAFLVQSIAALMQAVGGAGAVPWRLLTAAGAMGLGFVYLRRARRRRALQRTFGLTDADFD